MFTFINKVLAATGLYVPADEFGNEASYNTVSTEDAEAAMFAAYFVKEGI